jgi:hypothetical protein
MKFKLGLLPLLPLMMAANGHAQTVVQSYPTYPSTQTYTSYPSTQATTSTQTYPPITYQNSLTAPPVTNPATSLPGQPSTISTGLPGQPTSSQSTLPGNSTTPTSPSLLQSLYPQPAVPPSPNAPVQAPSPGLKFNPKPFENISGPESYLPGIATIKDKKWVVTDFLYNLTPNIGVKVEIIKPQGKYIPLSEGQLEQRIANLFQDADIDPVAIQMNCQPPLPMLYVLIMAYPCDKRIVGFISAQLYEEAKPMRIDMDLNGVWQTITWERQALVVAADKDFTQEVHETVTDMIVSFTERFKYYHPVDERECFPKQ